MGYRIHKCGDILRVQHILNGAIFGGLSGFTRPVFYGLTGLTMVFLRPVVETVTFVAGADPLLHTFKEIKTQIEAVVPDVTVFQSNDTMAIIEATPSVGVALSGGTACAKLGFSSDAGGWVYNYPDGSAPASAPYFVQMYYAEGQHCLVVRES